MEIFILLLLIFLNGLFVLGEIALISARKSRMESLANKGDLKAKAALMLIDHPERFLSTAQIGMTGIAILTGVYSGEKFGKDLEPFIKQIPALERYAASLSTTIVVVIVTFLSKIFGELIPKKLGLMQAEKIARIAAGPMNIISKIVYPFVWFLSNFTNLIFKIFGIKKPSDNAVTEEEIKMMISEGSEHGSIEEDEKEIIERVFHLGDRNITSLMTHRTEIVWLDINDTVADVKNKLPEIVYSTYPVCDGIVDEIK